MEFTSCRKGSIVIKKKKKKEKVKARRVISDCTKGCDEPALQPWVSHQFDLSLGPPVPSSGIHGAVPSVPNSPTEGHSGPLSPKLKLNSSKDAERRVGEEASPLDPDPGP